METCQRRTRSLALSDCGSHCNQEEWLKELEDTCPAKRLKDKQQEQVTRNRPFSTGRFVAPFQTM